MVSAGENYSLDDFRVWAEDPGRPVYSVVGIASPLREEIQYALQRRSDDRAGLMPRGGFRAVRTALGGASGRSLLDRDPDDPLFTVRYASPFLNYARERVGELADRTSGVSEWDRDVVAHRPATGRRDAMVHEPDDVIRVLRVPVVAGPVEALDPVAAIDRDRRSDGRE